MDHDLTAILAGKTSADLSTKSIAVLLFAIFEEKTTRLLTIQQNKITRKISFVQGSPTSISSNLKSETLGELLCSHGKISADEAQKLQSLAKQRLTPTALLGQLGRFTPDEATELISLVQQKRLIALFTLRTGSATFATSAATTKGKPIKDFMRAYLDGISQAYDAVRIAVDFPDIAEENHLAFDQDRAHALENLPFMPEEKGVITICSTCATVKEFIEQSLLEPVEKLQNLLKLKLLRIVSFVSAIDKQRKAFLSQLSQDQIALRHSVESSLTKNHGHGDYFELFEIGPHAKPHDIERACQLAAQKYSTNRLSSVFMPEEKQTLNDFMKLFRRAYTTINDADKRNEYADYKASGAVGAFESQSLTVAFDETLKQGSQLFKAGKYDEAGKIFALGLEKLPSEPILLAWLGRSLYKSGKKDAALLQIQTALTKDVACLEAHFVMAEVSLHQKDVSKARQHLIEILDRNPSHKGAKKMLKHIDPDGSVEIEIATMHKNLNKLSYYAILEISQSAKRADVQRAYHTRTRVYHPDRFFTSDNQQLRDYASKLYKRCVEAYMVLKSEDKRKEYDRQLQQADLPGQGVRLADASDVVQKKERSDIQIRNPQAKKFYTLALTNMQSNDYKGALFNLDLALKAEPNNALILKKIKEARTKSKER